MKLFVCCMLLIANINSHSKASVDSFVPENINVLLEDTTIKSGKTCNRPCKFNVKPRRCLYKFNIEPVIQDDGRPRITINGISPGPSINVCMNDVIIVEVKNKIPGQDLSIHWHGVEQKGTPFMDGVPMVTQCPISYGSTYKYAFLASSPGTFFYHADSVSHQSDGVYGSLVINQPQPLEAHSSFYDYDRSEEHTLLVAARFSQLLTGSLDDLSRLQPSSLDINGEEPNYKLFVMQGFAYRLRLINAIGLECPFQLHIDEHEMIVISTDGKPVKPVLTKKVLLYPGERMDVVVRASKESGGYWLVVRGMGACAGLHTRAMFLYFGFNYTSLLLDKTKSTEIESDTDAIAVSGQMLESIKNIKSNTAPVESIYLGIDRNIVKYNESDDNFRYTSEFLTKTLYYHAALTLQDVGVVQINNKSFIYPNTPMLLWPDGVSKDIKCNVGDEDMVSEIECLQILNAREGVLELALVNEGLGSNESYTFHMHGYGLEVVATRQQPYEKHLTKEIFLQLEREGKIVRNLQNPVVKDTITVPNKGFTIVRLRLDRGGSWLLECRSCALSSLPTALVINVPITIPTKITGSLPKCGSLKPPDELLS